MGEIISARWILARTELADRSEPYISRDELGTICSTYGLDAEQTHTLAALLHDLGHIIYYGDDEGLNQIVVLQPEWLTKAISYVLEDAPTRNANGVLYHGRLKEIWSGDSERYYPPRYHPYFLRLM